MLGNIATNRLTEDADFAKKKNIFLDEAHFDLGGYVNKQNWPTHTKRVTVRCGIWSRDIMGTFFFENEQEVAVIVNGDRYRAMLNEFQIVPKIEEEDMGNI